MSLVLACILAPLFAAFDDKDDLSNALKKFAEAKNYSFKGELTLTLPGRNGNAPTPTPVAFDGKFAEDVGLVVQTPQEELVRIDGKTAVRPKAVWRVIDDGGRGGRGQGLQAGFANRGGAGLLARAPKEELAGIDGKFDKVTKADKKESLGETECSVFEVSFSSEGAKSFVGGGRGPAGQDAEASASGHFWIASDGRLIKYEITSKVTRTFNNREMTTSTSRALTFSDVDKTKVELPAGAKEAIGQN
jgi:hypothetical protein